MAPQEDIPLSATVLGLIGTMYVAPDDLRHEKYAYTTVSQDYGASRIWQNWRRKETDGLPALMLFLWVCAVPPLGIYAIVQNFNIPLQLQPQIFGILALVCWAQTLIYGHGWRTWTATLLVSMTGVACAGLQVLLVFTLRGPYANGVSWPVSMIGIIAAVVLGAGLIPPYFELWKRGFRVIGINFIFLTTDWFGAFFSAMALAAQHEFDIIGGTSYTVCMILELGIAVSHVFWRIRTRRVHREAKRAGLSYDDYVASKHGLPAADSSVSLEKTALPAEANAGDTDLEKGMTQAAVASVPKHHTLLQNERGDL